ncbi:hypothetical protein [Streptomyces sp. NPDC053427]|uniref:hypothetical protein n=1 Tax=Streptomyces sp. NPDC053427 TaxID=3365701 RepID=UPI0037CD3842
MSVQERTRHKRRVDTFSPRTLADLARAGPAVKKPALIEAPSGRFDEYHGRLLHAVLDSIDHLTVQIRELDR